MLMNRSYDRTGTIRPITTRALYVKGLQQDLLGGTTRTNAWFRNGTVTLPNYVRSTQYTSAIFTVHLSAISATGTP